MARAKAGRPSAAMSCLYILGVLSRSGKIKTSDVSDSVASCDIYSVRENSG